MGFVIDLQVELDTEYASEADRMSHKLVEYLLTEADYVSAFSVSVPEPGTVDPDGEN